MEEGASGPGGVDLDELEGSLDVLAYRNRLELLRLLREPRTLGEIELTPGPEQAGAHPDRPISREAVRKHVNKLVDAGLVRRGTTARADGREVHEYVVDHRRLFAVAQELTKLSTLEATVPLDPMETIDLDQADKAGWTPGAKLVLARGVREGRAFPLLQADLDPGRDRGWVVGRSEDADVSLTYDPYVSAENAEILPDGDGFRLLDLRSATNRTYLNWETLPVGGEAELESGDVIGVGRSLLVFRST